jgi:beta-xylosidase
MRYLLFILFLSISILKSFSQDSLVIHGFVKEKFENYFIQNAKISVLVNDTNFYFFVRFNEEERKGPEIKIISKDYIKLKNFASKMTDHVDTKLTELTKMGKRKSLTPLHLKFRFY